MGPAAWLADCPFIVASSRSVRVLRGGNVLCWVPPHGHGYDLRRSHPEATARGVTVGSRSPTAGPARVISANTVPYRDWTVARGAHGGADRSTRTGASTPVPRTGFLRKRSPVNAVRQRRRECRNDGYTWGTLDVNGPATCPATRPTSAGPVLRTLATCNRFEGFSDAFRLRYTSSYGKGLGDAGGAPPPRRNPVAVIPG
jgi:hypothetical protein